MSILSEMKNSCLSLRLKTLTTGFMLFCLSSSVSAAELLTLSDIHFNPFEECHIAQTPCPLIEKLENSPAQDWPKILEQNSASTFTGVHEETNLPLLESTLNYAQSASHPDFIFLGGDYLGHDYAEKYALYSHHSSQADYEAFVNKTLMFLMNEVHSRFQNTPIIPAIGNNDSYSGDYVSDPDGLFFQQTGALFFPLLNHQDPSAFANTFDHNGTYSLTLSPSLRLIVINSVLFSSKGEVTSSQQKPLSAFAAEEIQWLSEELSLAEKDGQKVWILLHIPDVIDDYASKKAGKPVPLWDPVSDKNFLHLLNQHQATIQIIFSGHFHTDGEHQYGTILDTYLPGIDSTHGNLPGFKTYHFNEKTGQLTDIALYEIKNGQFHQTYLHALPEDN
jgi:sphingomyelin phosphodiesterase acid-like 3